VARTADTVARVGEMNSSWWKLPLPTRKTPVQLAARAIEALRAPMRIAGIDVHASPALGIALYPRTAHP